MVVKTELCAFSEYRVYPGHGIRFIRRDGQPITLSSSKCKSLLTQKKKSGKILWTQSWRRLHKKGQNENQVKRKTRKTTKVQRAIVGVSLEEIRKRRAAPKPKAAAPAAETAAKEVKDKAKTKAVKKALAAAAPKGKAIPKIQKSSASSGRGVTTR